jgi:hypothetical protein
VGAVLEVKSDLSKKWDEVLQTAKAVSRLTRRPRVTGMYGGQPPTRIPLFAVGYTGWKSLETLEEKMQDGPIDGILVINPGLFVSTRRQLIERQEEGHSRGDLTNVYSTAKGEDAEALWGFLCCLTEALHGMTPIGQTFTAYGSGQRENETQPPASGA